jgi:hypothetical protein
MHPRDTKQVRDQIQGSWNRWKLVVKCAGSLLLADEPGSLAVVAMPRLLACCGDPKTVPQVIPLLRSANLPQEKG